VKTALASAIVLALSLVAAAWMTMGARAFTAEQGRRLYVEEHHPQVPQARLIDATGDEHQLREWVQDDGRTWIVTFIYTRCPSLCSVLGTQYQRIQAELRKQRARDRYALLTISFDPRDDVAVMADYARRMGADPAIWQLASVADAADLPALLRFFGIVVIPDEFGEFQHNAALLWIDPSGRLTRIADVDELWRNPALGDAREAPR